MSRGIVFLHGLREKKDRRSFNVRITGLTNVPGAVISHTGAVLGSLRSTGDGSIIGGGARMGSVVSPSDKIRLDFFRLSSPILYRVHSRVLRLSVGGLAPISTLGGLGSVGHVMGKGWLVLSLIVLSLIH